MGKPLIVVLAALGLMFVVWGPGCSCDEEDSTGQPGGGGDGGAALKDTGAAGGDAGAADAGKKYVIEPPAYEKQPFQVIAEPSTTFALTGQEISIAARQGRGDAQGALTYAWDFGGGTRSSANAETAGTQGVTFSQAGRYIVTVTATDGGGNKSTAGLWLTVEPLGQVNTVGDVTGDGVVDDADVAAIRAHVDGTAPLSVSVYDKADLNLDGTVDSADTALAEAARDNGGKAPSLITPASGALGRVVKMIHPALLDPSKKAQVQFEGSKSLMTPVRLFAGHATFAVPPDMTTPGAAKVALFVDGAVEDTFDFEILAQPAASAVPGEKVVKMMDELAAAIAELSPVFRVYLEAAEVSDPQQVAVVMGLIRVAEDSIGPNKDAFLKAFADMEPEGRAAFEQVALANGLDGQISALSAARSQLEVFKATYVEGNALSAAAGAKILGVICTAKDIADIAAKVAEINETAASYLSWFDFWPVNKLPYVGQVITFLKGISNMIGAITDIIGLASSFVPDIGPVGVGVSPASVEIGSTSALSPYVTLVIAGKLCGQAAGAVVDAIMDKMQDMLLKRMANCIPGVDSMFASAQYERDNMGKVGKLIYDAISGIAGAILDATGIKDLMTKLAEAVCSLLKEPTVPLKPDVLSCGCQDVKGGTFTCVEACVGAQTIMAKPTICGEEKEGEGAVTCIGCDQNNCAGGCCDSGKCVLHAQQTVEKCGTGAAACAKCDTTRYETCQNGACVCVGDCTTVGNKECRGGSLIFECREVPEHPGCLKWMQAVDCVAQNGLGARCENAVCVGGCNAANCGSGCCQTNGDCQPGTSNDACGQGAEECVYCNASFDLECRDRKCQAKPCSTRCDGCCNGETCVPLPLTTDSTCGKGGAACVPCDTNGGYHCNAGECQKGVVLDGGTDDGGVVTYDSGTQDAGGGGTCKCGDPGVTLTSEGCDGWPDANQCSGFGSAYCGGKCGDNSECWMACESEWPNTEFQNGFSGSYLGCTITVHCP
ncbi:MAG: PKD domain-containing protein [Deltaproteobacteria bacterium]|nr:PKD domain-containing protein [Deltaproteobacteria bacterium]